MCKKESATQNVNMNMIPLWSAFERVTTTLKSVAMSVLLYDCTTWNITKCLETKLDWNYSKRLPAIWNKSWKKYSTKQQLISHLPPTLQTIQIKQTRYIEYCLISKDEFISNILQ